MLSSCTSIYLVCGEADFRQALFGNVERRGGITCEKKKISPELLHTCIILLHTRPLSASIIARPIIGSTIM